MPSCSAFSSSAFLACSTSWFLVSTSVFCSRQQLGLFLQFGISLLQLQLLALQLFANAWLCSRSCSSAWSRQWCLTRCRWTA